ncbi:MAG: hypothetical protein WH035_08840 [Spirochaetota bacterium]
MKNIKISISLLIISVILVSFSFISSNDEIKIVTIDNILSQKYKSEDFLIKNQIAIYDLIKYVKNKYEFEEYNESWSFDLNTKNIINEISQKEFYSKSVFSNDLKLLYKETFDKEKKQLEKFIYNYDFYIFQKYINEKLNEEKRIKPPEKNIILMDLLPIVLRILIANKFYEKEDRIKIFLGFLQSSIKIPIIVNFKKIFSFEELNINIDKSYLKNFYFNSSILCEIIGPDLFLINKVRTLYLFSFEQPYNQKLVYIGNEKNFYLIILK